MPDFGITKKLREEGVAVKRGVVGDSLLILSLTLMMLKVFLVSRIMIPLCPTQLIQGDFITKMFKR